MHKQCSICERPYKLTQSKPGLVSQCWDCGQEYEDEKDIQRVGGNMIWLHKTGPEIEIKSMEKTKLFAKMTKRLGAGVTMSLCVSKTLLEQQMDMDKYGVRYDKNAVSRSDDAPAKNKLGENLKSGKF